MPSEARQKKIMEKLNRAQKCSILGPQNLGSGGGPGPPGPPLDPHLVCVCVFVCVCVCVCQNLYAADRLASMSISVQAGWNKEKIN